MICWKCGSQINDANQYCAVCGSLFVPNSPVPINQYLQSGSPVSGLAYQLQPQGYLTNTPVKGSTKKTFSVFDILHLAGAPLTLISLLMPFVRFNIISYWLHVSGIEDFLGVSYLFFLEPRFGFWKYSQMTSSLGDINPFGFIGPYETVAIYAFYFLWIASFVLMIIGFILLLVRRKGELLFVGFLVASGFGIAFISTLFYTNFQFSQTSDFPFGIVSPASGLICMTVTGLICIILYVMQYVIQQKRSSKLP